MALGEILSFEAWLAGPGRNTVTWPADRQRKAYNSYVAAQQKYLAGKQGYDQELAAYREAYKGSSKGQAEADKAFRRAHVQAVSGSANLRRDVNDYFRSKGAKGDRFPQGADLELAPRQDMARELAAWGTMFSWLKSKDQKRHTQDLGEYNRLTQPAKYTWWSAVVGYVAEAPAKTEKNAPAIWARIQKGVESRAKLPAAFYQQAVQEKKERDIASGQARRVGDVAPAGAPGAAPAAGATIGGYSLVTILIVLVIVGLVGYGIYYVATQ